MQVSQYYLDYVGNYKDIAIQEMQRVGMPASIKLAQALLESDAGRSELARLANNHFGIKCGSDWNGQTYLKEDDEYDANGQLVASCFRVYQTPEESFVAQSDFLHDPKKSNRYGFLFNLNPTDYRSWATGLQTSGYATASDYATKLIGIIELYQLYQYDILSNAPISPPFTADTNPPQPPVIPMEPFPAPPSIPTNSGSNIESPDGGSPRPDAGFTDDFFEDDQPQPADSSNNTNTYYTVKAGDTLWAISQQYGVSVDELKRLNNLDSDLLSIGMQLRVS